MERFRRWRRGRPFWGASLTILAGIELFLSARLDIAVGGMVLQLGVPGLQTTIIPVVMVLAGALVMVQPVHHVFYGVITLALSVYSLVAVNLGGMGVGTILGIVGSIVVVSWLGRADAQAPPAPAAEPAPAAADADPFLLFDDGPQPDPTLRRSVATTLSLALVAGGLVGGVPSEGPCLLGFILCDLPTGTASPSPSASAPAASIPSASPAPAEAVPPGSTPSPSPSDLGDVVGDIVDGVGGGVGDGVGDGVEDALGDVAGGVAGTAGGAQDDAAQPAPAAEPPAPGVTVGVPQDVPLPADEDLPVVLGGTEDVDVYAVPAELTATDLEIGGIRAVALVSVPVGSESGERRNALKLVADHVKVAGFRLHTYAGAGDRAGGTDTTADYVTMDGRATMYITSLTASGPDGKTFTIDADDPPPTLTSLVLAAVRPTVGLLGATSDRQEWSGFHEQLWAR